MSKRAPFSVAVAVLLFSLSSPALADECQGVTMPGSVRVDGQRLSLNGMGVREATVFNVNVYVAGLYVEGGRSRNASQILETARRKQLVLHFMRDVDRGDITEAFTEGLRHSAGGDFSGMRNQLTQLNRWMGNMSEGDRMAFTYVPGTGLEVKVKGRVKGTIAGDDFARAFFGIWIGSHPPNAGLKTGLLGGSCG